MASEKVKAFLEEKGIADRILEFDESTMSCEMAAGKIGCSEGEICKAMAFDDGQGGCILVQSAGDVKVKGSKFRKQFGFGPSMLSAFKVKKLTGHLPGGICGFAITSPKVKVFCDVSMKRFEKIYPACGTDRSAIPVSLDELVDLTGSQGWIDVCTEPAL
jgi:prolyl-tRNA editing enzyme YbaK/EbsC (Cys-tRNA(Pro) deacylase)